MENLTGLVLMVLLSVGSIAQAAPQVCQGEDRQHREKYYLQVEEMGLPKGAIIDLIASQNGYHPKARYQVSSYMETGFGTYVNLKFVSGDVNRSYRFLIGVGKTFLVTNNGSAQLHCE